MCGKSNDMWSKMRILKINLRESMMYCNINTLEEILPKMILFNYHVVILNDSYTY